MPGKRVDFVPAARQELDEAVDWYLDRNESAAASFVREVDRAIAIVLAAPHVWPRFDGATRRYILRTFPYDLVYRERTTGIEILAVAHHKRRPRYWRRRPQS